MKYQAFWYTKIVTVFSTFVFVLPLFCSPSVAQEEQQQIQYSCGTYKGTIPALIAKTAYDEYVPIQFISEYFSKKGFTPIERCRIIAEKFQRNMLLGTLYNYVPGTFNNQSVICASKVDRRSSYPCEDNNVLFTLKPGQKADDVIDYIVKQAQASSGLLPSEQNSPIIKIKHDQNGEYKVIDANALFSISPSVKK
jgi:Circadian oscillating protein COP23